MTCCAGADAIFIEELRKADLYDKVSQAFTVFLPVRSVGVMGDGRKYDWVVSLRAVETIDFMTAHWAHLPYDFLGRVSNRIINEVNGISRVVYDISGKPPGPIEWECLPCTMNEQNPLLQSGFLSSRIIGLKLLTSIN